MISGISPLLNYKKLEQLANTQADVYQQAAPFPHIAIDNFIDGNTVTQILKHFPDLREKPTQATLESGKFPQPNKLWLSNQAGVDPIIRHLYWELNSAPFLLFLEKGNAEIYSIY